MMNYESHLSSKVFRWACSLCLKVVNADVRSLENPFVLAMAAPTPTPLRRSRDAPLLSVSDTFKEVEGVSMPKCEKKKRGMGGRVEMINHDGNLQNEAMKGMIRPMRLHSAARGSTDAVSPVPCPFAALDAPSFGALMNLLRFCPPFPALVPGPQ